MKTMDELVITRHQITRIPDPRRQYEQTAAHIARAAQRRRDRQDMLEWCRGLVYAAAGSMLTLLVQAVL